MIMAEQVLVAKSEQLHGIVDELLGIVSEAVQQQTPIHQVKIVHRGREMEPVQTFLTSNSEI